jgi:hypothetical protein
MNSEKPKGLKQIHKVSSQFQQVAIIQNSCAESTEGGMEINNKA